MDITKYLVDSCVMQEDTTPEAFVGMTRAYYYTSEINNRLIHLSDLRTMNGLIRGGELLEVQRFRTTPVYFADGSFAPDADNLERLMAQWRELYADSHIRDPDLVYFELMRIHPFQDGNGRVGSLVWNHMRCMLHKPGHPPKYETLKARYSTPLMQG